MDAAFSTQILAEKLSKLNNSQQSIESLSLWCINYRKKARQIVEIWEKWFNSSPKEKKVPFLYLANDILQNSRRKGSEFVNEFWKLLPGSLKVAYENGEENIKNSVMRLADIWDERKVFGSRGRGLKDYILGNAPPGLPPLSESNGKNSNPIKLVRKDAHSVRIKLAVGGMPERIVTAYQAVLDEHFDEDTALNKCKSAVCAMENMEKEVNNAYAQGSQHGISLMVELKEQETVLKQCIEQLEQVEATRASLVSQLKEALQEQESKLDLIRAQLQVAQIEAEHAINMRQKLSSMPTTTGPNMIAISMTPQVEASPAIPPMLPSHSQQPVTSSMNSLTSAEDEHKKAAAAVAAKLAASTSSAQVLTSILSSLVAEEAASKNNGSHSSGFIASSNPMLPPDKRPKLEKPMSVADMSSKFFGHIASQQQQHQHPSLPLLLSQSPTASVQPLSQSTQPMQAFPTQPPPLPSIPPPSMQPQPYMQGSGVLMNTVPFAYNGSPLPPPPPFPSHISLGMTRLNGPTQPPPPATLPQPKQQQQHQPQQQPTTAGFYPSAGIGFYGQLPAAPAVPRQ